MRWTTSARIGGSILLAIVLSVVLFYVGRSMVAVRDYTRNAIPAILPASPRTANPPRSPVPTE